MGKEQRKKTNDPTLKRIMTTLLQQKKTVKDLEMALDLSNGTVSKWKYSEYKPYERYLPLISEYLNVSEAELVGKNENGNAPESENMYEISTEELKMLEMYRELDIEGKSYMNQTIRYMLDIEKFRKILENGSGSH